MLWIAMLLFLLQPTDEDYLVEAEISDSTPYVGEMVTYVLRYYDYPQSTQLDYELAKFGGFWVTDTFTGTGGIAMIGNRQYGVGELLVEMFPVQSGPVNLTPSWLIVPETPFREGVSLPTESLDVLVRPLPPDAPMSFNGAVGRFSAETGIDRTTITLGEPVTLTLAVTGSGNLELLPVPELDLPDGWRAYANPPQYTSSVVNGLRFGEKTFEWLIVPQQTGTQDLPPILFSYFDPDMETYRTIETLLYTINVFPGEENLRELPTRSAPLSGESLPLKSVSGRAAAGDWGVVFWLMWLIPPVIFASMSGGSWLRRVYHERQLDVRRRKALPVAQARLKAARQPQEIVRAIQAYVIARMGRDQMTYQEVESALGGTVAHDCLLDAQSARFAPEGSVVDVRGLAGAMLQALTELDEVWP